ncbi:cupin domain-containing protein [uncultured Ruegeria sp.]|uniref:cupin domain-containing protein n=1 Tax=uncultured Ruegeria sp. TaxID=259304 RepID=UPI002626E6C0|nr:cupin domain-containing protein [uncultured Ruegeria sp.]
MNKMSFRLIPSPDNMVASDFTDPGAFTTSDTNERNWFKFANDDETILSGVWECPPSREEIDAYPVHEMMTVISGSVTLTHPDGDAETFTAGDTFFIKKGSRLIWEITEKLRKYYMIVS